LQTWEKDSGQNGDELVMTRALPVAIGIRYCTSPDRHTRAAFAMTKKDVTRDANAIYIDP
jgi:hypothetical protein